MKQKKVWLMCGIPAAGKSNFIRLNKGYNDIWISRDLIRFSLVKEDEPYFSKEKQVFKSFIQMINAALALPQVENVFVDATHITPQSRHKVLSALELENCEVIAVNFLVPLDICLCRNSIRAGRQRVPEDIIQRMYENFIPATTDEEYIDEIKEVSK